MAILIITHNHENGTTLTGSQRGDGVYEIVNKHHFTYRPNPGIFIRGSRDKDAHTWKINAAAEALRAAGHQVTIEIDNTPRPTEVVEADRSDHAADRADRYADRAARAETRSDAARAASRQISNGIPFGQPKLVGHHSYARACRDEDRMHSLDERSTDEAGKAQYLSGRADSAERSQGRRENPRVTMRRIKKLQADRRSTQRSLDGYTRNFRNNQGEIYTTDEHKPASGAWREQLLARAAHLDEQIAHWQKHLATQAESAAFVAWDREHFQRGDWANVGGRWCEVARVNTKSVSVRALYDWCTRDDIKPVPWDEIHGRRRDGMQSDSPNGEPWPVELAKRVARWAKLTHGAGVTGTPERERWNVEHAARMARGLPITAQRSELEAFPEPADVAGRRALADLCMSIYERLEAGELVPDIAASITPFDGGEPAWRMPAGPTINRRVDQLVPGDIVAGYYDTTFGGNRLEGSFCGPVKHVSGKDDRREAGEWYTVTLRTGASSEVRAHRWFAVHPVNAEVVRAADLRPGEVVIAYGAERTMGPIDNHGEATFTDGHRIGPGDAFEVVRRAQKTSEAEAVEAASGAVDQANAARREAQASGDTDRIEAAREEVMRAKDRLSETLREVSPEIARILNGGPAEAETGQAADQPAVAEPQLPPYPFPTTKIIPAFCGWSEKATTPCAGDLRLVEYRANSRSIAEPVHPWSRAHACTGHYSDAERALNAAGIQTRQPAAVDPWGPTLRELEATLAR